MVGVIKEVCPKCHGPVSYDRAEVSEGYHCCCNKCDEDYYKFELKRVIEPQEGQRYNLNEVMPEKEEIKEKPPIVE